MEKENSLNISTHEESSKIESEKGQNEYANILSNRISVQNNHNHIIQNKLKEIIINNKNEINSESNKLSETLPVQNTISSFKFKIVLIGNIAVGKSSIIKRFTKNEFNEEYTCTIGTELSQILY